MIHYRSYVKYEIYLILLITLLVSSCSNQPDISPQPASNQCKECDCKEWRFTTPYLGNDEILEAKGVSNPSPNFQKMRDDAIQNAINTLSTLFESNIDRYTEKYIHEYQNYADGDKISNELYDKLVTASNKNTVKRVKMDECEDPKTGRYWVFAYISTAAIDVASADVALQLDDFITDQQKELFRAKRNKEREDALRRELELNELAMKKIRQ